MTHPLDFQNSPSIQPADVLDDLVRSLDDAAETLGTDAGRLEDLAATDAAAITLPTSEAKRMARDLRYAELTLYGVADDIYRGARL